MNLSQLEAQYNALKRRDGTSAEKARRGLDFERLLSHLFRQQKIAASEPFRVAGEQIDGAFEHKGSVYLVEAKWRGQRTSTDAMYAFEGKVSRRPEGTRGLFISIPGFQKAAVARYKIGIGTKPNMLLWSSEHVEVVLSGQLTVQALLDISLRVAAERGEPFAPARLLIQLNDKAVCDAADQACAAQVGSEIGAMAATKYIPNLYVDRELESRLHTLIRPPRPPLDEVSSDADGKSRINSALPLALRGKLHVVLGRAGTGKTNLFCHLAKHYVKEQPAVLLTGRSGITASISVWELIESRLSQFAADPLRGEFLLDRLVGSLERDGRTLLVFLDGVNEHENLSVMDSAIKHFLVDIEGKPMLAIASCRDVYWPFFDRLEWPPSQWSEVDLQLDLFSPGERDDALGAYFDFYRIEADLSFEARDRLSHPLLLRFFCEAYGDLHAGVPVQLGEVHDIRLKVLFDDYLRRKLDSMCHTAPKRRRTPWELEQYLYALAERMRVTKSTSIDRDVLADVTREYDLDSPESSHVAILGEDIILEEDVDRNTRRIRVVFTYEEFMEYMIASSMVRSCQPLDNAGIVELIRECQRGASEFPHLIGVLEYLAIILREDHGRPIWEGIDLGTWDATAAVCRAVGKLGAEHIGEPELETLTRIALGRSHGSELRARAADGLVTIATDARYDRTCRAGAVRCLAQVLARSDDAVARASAVRPFEDAEVASLDPVAKQIARWWQRKQVDAREQHILWADDNPGWLAIVVTVLREHGFGLVGTAYGASEARRIVKEWDPALVVSGLDDPVEGAVRVLQCGPRLSARRRAELRGGLCGSIEVRSSRESDDQVVRAIIMALEGKLDHQALRKQRQRRRRKGTGRSN